MHIVSPAFEDSKSLPVAYTCDGVGHNPPLSFSQIPLQAKSLVLFIEDPDAPGGTFIHWVLYNIAPTHTRIEENHIPEEALEGLNSAGRIGYIPPCPPSHIHHYIFRLFALDTTLTLPEGSSKEEVMENMQNHIIEQAEIVGLYGKA